MRVDVHDDGDAERRLARTARRMARGALAGRSAVAQPVMPRPVYRDIILPRGGGTLPKFLIFATSFDDDTSYIELSPTEPPGPFAGGSVSKIFKWSSGFGIMDPEFELLAGDMIVQPTTPGTFLVGCTVGLQHDSGPDTCNVLCTVGDGYMFPTLYTDMSHPPEGFHFSGAPSGLIETFEPLYSDEGFGAYATVSAGDGMQPVTRKFLLNSATMWGVRISDDAFALG